MTNIFEILDGLLNRTEVEVEGRALEELPEVVRLKLRAFARGALPVAEQTELIGQLNQNRHWLACLADEVKALRTPAGPKNP